MTESHDRTLFDVTDEDRRWFESHPTLRHRVRWTDPVEVDEYAIVTRVAPPTGRLATWVTCLEPGVRARRLLAPPSTGAYGAYVVTAGVVALVGHDETLRYLERLHGELPRTWRATLGDDDVHALLFRAPTDHVASLVELDGCVVYVGSTSGDVVIPGIWSPTARTDVFGRRVGRVEPPTVEWDR